MNRYIIGMPFNPHRIGNILNQIYHFIQKSESSGVNVGFTEIEQQEYAVVFDQSLRVRHGGRNTVLRVAIIGLDDQLPSVDTARCIDVTDDQVHPEVFLVDRE